jgi:aminoglycoside 6'-N-acetyltransferase I
LSAARPSSAATWKSTIETVPAGAGFGYDDAVVEVHIRPALPPDEDTLTGLRHALWPEGSLMEHEREIKAILNGKPPGALPLAILVAEADDHALIGFLEVGLRSHAEGCDPSRPVGYVEGWYLSEDYRRQGVGSQLVAAAEAWARAQNCRELASDSQFDNHVSQRALSALGFEEVERSISYRKVL